MATSIPEEIITLNPEGIDFGDSEAVKALILKLLNIIESQAQFNEELQNENQSLKDEINRLKGEKGKPKFPPKTVESGKRAMTRLAHLISQNASLKPTFY